jgi:3-methyladenine DNA glycosylase/8-oxoguanine DNA glycosylase
MVALRAEGVDMRRAGAIRNAAPYLARLDAAGSRADLLAILQRLPGVGPWTIGNVMGYAGGDPDAVPVGDLHLPRNVGEAFEGIPADDARMLELLEPYRGLRFRVLLWIMAG